MKVEGITTAHDAFLEWIHWCNNDVTHISFKQLSEGNFNRLRDKDDSGYIRNAKIYNENGMTHMELMPTKKHA